MPEAVIVDAIRTPIGRAFKGSLAGLRPDETNSFFPNSLYRDWAVFNSRLCGKSSNLSPRLHPHSCSDDFLRCNLCSHLAGRGEQVVLAAALLDDNGLAAGRLEGPVERVELLADGRVLAAKQGCGA